MFIISDLKARGLAAFKKNYWWCVLVALITGFAVGGSGGGTSSSSSRSFSNSNSNSGYNSYNSNYDDDDNDNIYEHFTDSSDPTGDLALVSTILVAFMIVFVILMIIGWIFAAFVKNPLAVGCQRYWLLNSNTNPSFGEIGYSFKKGRYMNIVKTEFLKGLFIGLWSLLCVIPGIVKSYQYYLVSYILAEDPDIEWKDALEKSKQMMDGYKMDTFLLELSFIGWDLLSILTCGILSIFYVNPYRYATKAEIYHTLRGKFYTDPFDSNNNPKGPVGYVVNPGEGAMQQTGGYSTGQQFTPYNGSQQNTSAAGQQTNQYTGQQYNPYGEEQRTAQQYTPYGEQQPSQQYDPYSTAGQQYDPYGSQQSTGQQYDPYGSQPSGGAEQQTGPYASTGNYYDPYSVNPLSQDASTGSDSPNTSSDSDNPYSMK